MSLGRGEASRLPLVTALFASLLIAACTPLPRAGGPPAPGTVVDIVFPLAADSVRFTSGWGDPRAGGRSHRGMDIFVPRFTPILAAANGTVDWVATSRPARGRSYSLLLRGDDGHVYFYDHLNNDNPGTRDNLGEPRHAYARGLRNGDRVVAGDIIGYVGDSGNAEPAGPHLHFEIHRGTWGNALDPEPSLRRALARRASGVSP